jgi:hypothetical protein
MVFSFVAVDSRLNIHRRLNRKASERSSKTTCGGLRETWTMASHATSPKPTTDGSSGRYSIPLASTPNGAFLIAGHFASSDFTVFRIDARTGALTRIPGSPFPASGPVNGMKVTPNGKFLAASFGGLGGLEMFKVSYNGALSPVPGSPFGAF